MLFPALNSVDRGQLLTQLVISGQEALSERFLVLSQREEQASG